MVPLETWLNWSQKSSRSSSAKSYHHLRKVCFTRSIGTCGKSYDLNLTAYADRLVKPTIHGKGRDGEEIYHFTKDGMNVALITENYGKSGQIIMDRKSNEKYKVRLV